MDVDDTTNARRAILMGVILHSHVLDTYNTNYKPITKCLL